MITKKITLEQVTEAVLKVVKEDIGIDKVDVNETLKNLDIDSLTFAEILVNVEDALQVEFDLDDSLSQEDDLTVKQFIEAIHEGLNEK